LLTYFVRQQNGQDILDSLSQLKPSLVERYERWLAAHPNALDPTPALPPPVHRSSTAPSAAYPDGDTRPRTQSDPRPRANGYSSRSSQDDARRSQAQAEARQRVQAEALRKQEQERRVAGELEMLRQQRQQSERYGGNAGKSPADGRVETETRRREDVVRQRDLDLTFSRRQDQHPNHRQSEYSSRARSEEARSNQSIYGDTAEAQYKRQEDARRSQQQQQYKHQQEEMRRREEEITRRRLEERRKAEQEGIAKRQQESDLAARAERQNVSVPSSSAPPSQYQTQMGAPAATSAMRAPRALSSTSASFLDTYSDSLSMPLESPTRYEGDSTDSEAVGDGSNSVWRHIRNGRHPLRAPPKRYVFSHSMI
jgi:STAM-binding protein